jgi:hypothetical protein
VGAVLGAGLECVLAELAIGADGGEEDEGLLGEAGEVFIGEVANLNAGLFAVRVELLALGHHILQFGLRAAGHCPLEIGGQMRRDVLGGVLSGVAWVQLVVLAECRT